MPIKKRGFPTVCHVNLFLVSYKLLKADHDQTIYAAADSNDAEKKQEGGEDSQGQDREEEELWETENTENMKTFIDPQPVPEPGTLHKVPDVFPRL